VNKLNTKAGLTCPVDASWIPAWAHADLRACVSRTCFKTPILISISPYIQPHYISSTDTIMITSSAHRSQAQNVDDSLSKACATVLFKEYSLRNIQLHALVLAASAAPIRKEPTEEQKKRVATLQRIDKNRRREQKSRHSEIKKGRATGKKGGWD
jgi:peptidyl-tRNA hydrolase ICT1